VPHEMTGIEEMSPTQRSRTVSDEGVMRWRARAVLQQSWSGDGLAGKGVRRNQHPQTLHALDQRETVQCGRGLSYDGCDSASHRSATAH